MYTFLLEHILLPIGDFLNRSSYMKQLKYWREVDRYSKEALENLQQDNLRKVLLHTLESVPFYKELNVSSGDPEDMLRQFPVIDKYIIRDHTDELLSEKFNKKKLISYSSSGSSGVQTTVYMTKEEQSAIRGILTHWWEWTGYTIGTPLVQTGITPNRGFQKSLKDMLFRTIYLNAFSHTDEQLDLICQKIYKKPNTYYIAGYASSLYVLAEYTARHGYHLKLKGVVSLGDKLYGHYKDSIEMAFKTKVYDTYGSNEGLMIAAQHDLNAYYIASPHVYVEILDDNNDPVPDGKMGNMVITRLDGFAMPLIRYKLGDLGVKLPLDEYPENKQFQYPLLKEIVGRETDIIVLPDCSKMVVHSFTGIFEYLPDIQQFKIIQEDINGIVIEYVKSEDFHSSTIEKATSELRKYIKAKNFSITFREVNDILPSTSGKPMIVESRLNNK